MTPTRTLTSSHWGVYEVEWDDGRAKALRPFPDDPDPSPIGLYALSDEVARLRVRRPAVRRSWLDGGPGSRPDLRGREAFVEVGWDEAIRLVADELARVKGRHGNEAIFGGSYGWSSAGRFHHAQSQIHRFLNAIGGYVRHVDSYSLGAARVLMPHIVMSMDELMSSMTSWDVLAKHCELFVTFGGVPHKNAQISQGGTSEHRLRDGLFAMRAAGARFVNVTPTRDDLDTGGAFDWIAIRPNTDTALMLALAHTLHAEGLHAPDFLARHTVGFDRFAAYLTGASDGQAKDATWAEAITGVPAARIVALARDMAARRTMLNISWSLQRAQHGEQPFWTLVTLACMLGQIGLPGGGFGVGYGATNLMGSPHARFGGPTLPQGDNAVSAFIPVARIADMLLNPGATFAYNGRNHVYPDIRLIYWAGGNPFHHHQDLNRLMQAWRKPETIVVHEQFWTPTAKFADIVLPATTALERNDIGFASRERHIVAMRRACEPAGEARDDFAIFSDIAGRLGAGMTYTENRSVAQWLEHLYETARERARGSNVDLPPFATFWAAGIVTVEGSFEPPIFLADFRHDPDGHPLKTPSGKIEIYSERIAGFGYGDCPGHPVWMAPTEWLGGATAARFPLHLLSDQPTTRLHSQLDHSPYSQAAKVKGRQPVTISRHDAAARGIADGDFVRIFNDRGACVSAAIVSDAIRPGVARLSTGAWFDPHDTGANRPLEKHGNPNVLTLDRGASQLSQGCTAQTCLVEIERYDGEPPGVTAHTLPQLLPARA
ncbi:MAG: molybdopterin guanine dinucleotide-containing S/N-oxide reductase [Alphaproteobacteria bacterium]|nr:molybdopterin guanine dinucleotide-containing S/N-oxide reductase [Alphaproteobacteria bacterium]